MFVRKTKTCNTDHILLIWRFRGLPCGAKNSLSSDTNTEYKREPFTK